MANLADSEKYANIEFRVNIDPKDGNLYLTSTDSDLMEQTAGGFRLPVQRGTRQDQALRAMLKKLKDDKSERTRNAIRDLPVGSMIYLNSAKQVSNISMMQKLGGITIDLTGKPEGSLNSFELMPPTREAEEPNKNIKFLLEKTEEQKFSNFSGHRAFSVPLGININSLKQDKEGWHKPFGVSWNGYSYPNLYITGQVATGKTTLLNRIEKYFLHHKLNILRLSLSNLTESLTALTALEKIMYVRMEEYSSAEAGAKNYLSSVPSVPDVVIIDDIDSLFRGRKLSDLTYQEFLVFEKIRFIVLRQSEINNVHLIIAGTDFREDFRINTELILNRVTSTDKNSTPITDEIIDYFESTGHKYYIDSREFSTDIPLATFIHKHTSDFSKKTKIIDATQIALYQFDE